MLDADCRQHAASTYRIVFSAVIRDIWRMTDMFRNALVGVIGGLIVVAHVQATSFLTLESAPETSTAIQAALGSLGVVGAMEGSKLPDLGVAGGIDPVITPVHLGEVSQTTPIIANLTPIGAPTVWSNLMSVEGSPAIPATVTSTGLFTWDPTGSARGPKGNGVFYSWSVTLSNPGGSSTGVAIMLSLIPEPATLVLFGTIALCIATIPSRCRSSANRGVIQDSVSSLTFAISAVHGSET
jgi:hypothetical protein